MNLKSIYLRVVFGCIIAIFVLEMCARIDDFVSYGAPILSSYNSEMLYEQDNIGKKGKPNARYRKWQLNGLGYRGPELQKEKIEVVCFGSSETFGLYETPGGEYPRQLEREIVAQSGEPFQVINVAYPGETIATATRRVPEIVAAIHPRFAFVYPSPATYIWVPWLDAANKSTPAAKHNHFEWRIGENLRIIGKQVVPHFVQNGLRMREIRDLSKSYTVMDRVPDANVKRFRMDLGALVVALKSRGVTPILVTHATMFGSGHLPSKDYEMLVAWRRFYPMLREEGFLDMEHRMNDAIRTVAQENGVTLVDAAEQIPPGREYFADFVHFTDLGSHTMAIKLAASLNESSLKQHVMQSSSMAQPLRSSISSGAPSN